VALTRRGLMAFLATLPFVRRTRWARGYWQVTAVNREAGSITVTWMES
jgi:hypothetical protein